MASIAPPVDEGSAGDEIDGVLVAVHGLRGCLCHAVDPEGQRGGMSIDLDITIGDEEAALDLVHAAVMVMGLSEDASTALCEHLTALVAAHGGEDGAT